MPRLERVSQANPETTASDNSKLLQVLSTEHWSLLSARGLAYNEAFTRASMFLNFLSITFVGLALLSGPMGFTRDFLVVVAVVLGFDVVIGLVTFYRIGGCNEEDLRATHGMNRIRNGYVRIVPESETYFVTGTHDDIASVMKTYFGEPTAQVPRLAAIAYGLTTSAGMVGLIVSLVFGALATVVALLLSLAAGPSVPIGALAAVAMFVYLVVTTYGAVARSQAALETRFPSTDRAEPSAPESGKPQGPAQ